MRAIFAIVLLISPIGSVAAPAAGTVQGVVSVAGNPASGLGIALVELSAGRVVKLRSSDSGTFEAQVPPGEYLITSREIEGLGVVSAPTLLTVTQGQVTTARLDLAAPLAAVVSVSGASIQAAAGGEIDHAPPFTCWVAGSPERPLGPVVEACFANLSPDQLKADTYFSGGKNLDDPKLGAFYSVEMTCEPAAGGSCCTATLPYPIYPDVGKMIYYLTANGGDIAGNPETEHFEVNVKPDPPCDDGPEAMYLPAGALALGGGSLAVPAAVVLASAAGAGGVAALSSETTTTTTTTPPATEPPTTTTATTTPTLPPEPDGPPASPSRDLALGDVAGG